MYLDSRVMTQPETSEQKIALDKIIEIVKYYHPIARDGLVYVSLDIFPCGFDGRARWHLWAHSKPRDKMNPFYGALDPGVDIIGSWINTPRSIGLVGLNQEMQEIVSQYNRYFQDPNGRCTEIHLMKIPESHHELAHEIQDESKEGET